MKNPEKKRTESRRETGQTRCRWMKRWKGREKKKNPVKSRPKTNKSR